MVLAKTVLTQVWVKHNGKVFSAPCKCCSNEINALDYHVAHLTSAKSQDDLENLRPVCKSCFTHSKSSGLLAYKVKNFPDMTTEQLRSTISKLTPESRNELSVFISEISSESKTCAYVFVRGKNTGQTCTKTVTEGSLYCRDCRTKKSVQKQVEPSQTEVPEKSPTGKCTYVFPKGKLEGQNCTNNVYDGSQLCSKCNARSSRAEKIVTGKCSHVITRGPRSGHACGFDTFDGETYCFRCCHKKHHSELQSIGDHPTVSVVGTDLPVAPVMTLPVASLPVAPVMTLPVASLPTASVIMAQHVPIIYNGMSYPAGVYPTIINQ